MIADDLFNSDYIEMLKTTLRPEWKFVYVNPKDFLNLALRVKNEIGYSEDKYKRASSFLDKGEVFPDLPFLRLGRTYEVNEFTFEETIKEDSLSVISHEGRHRNRTLMEKGYTKVPLILKYPVELGVSIPKYIVNQDNDKRYRWTKVFIEP